MNCSLQRNSLPKGQNCIILLIIRTAIFSDDTSLDERKNLIHTDREIAEILQQTADSIHGFCARFKDRLFAIGLTGNFTQHYAGRIADNICTQIQYLSLYQKSVGTDSIVTKFLHIPAETVSPKENISFLVSQVIEEMQTLSMRYAPNQILKNLSPSDRKFSGIHKRNGMLILLVKNCI